MYRLRSSNRQTSNNFGILSVYQAALAIYQILSLDCEKIPWVDVITKRNTFLTG